MARDRDVSHRREDLRICFGAIPDYRDHAEQMASIAVALSRLALEPALLALAPECRGAVDDLLRALDAEDPEMLEARVLHMYSYLHEAGEHYTPEERRKLDARGGYICYAGGLSPILKAAPYIGADTVSVDLGAGNGLQGLLLQTLYPHRKTLQVELSGALVKTGQILQRVLEIPQHRIEWHQRDIADVSLAGVDFVYLYRPVRPRDEGKELYQALAQQLEALPGRVVVFSVADCLGRFLSPHFMSFAFDAHLTCYTKQPG